MTEQTIEVGRPEYLSVAETAKLVRKALAKAFPAYDFQVRSHSYANGASINVDYVDGPPARVVDSVIKGFAGSGFDGMIDMAFHFESWLDADGTAHVAGSPGTSGSRGVYEPFVTDAPSPNARLVHFGADHVFSNRSISPQGAAFLEARATARYGPLGNDYTDDRMRAQVAERWLFPPTTHTWSVERGHGEAQVVEAEGLPSKSAAEKVAKAHEKGRHDGVRTYRTITPHRSN